MEGVRIDSIDALKAVQGMQIAFERPAPFLQLIAEELYRVARVSFSREASPDQQEWVPLSLKYAQRKSKLFKGRGILRFRGRLIRGLRRGVEGRIAFVSEGPLAYAAIHMYGGRAGRKHKARIPARPSMGFPKASQELVVKDIQEQIVADFNKGAK